MRGALQLTVLRPAMTKPVLYIFFVASAFAFVLAEFLATGIFKAFGPFPLAHGLFVAMLALWWLRLDADAGHPSGPLLKVFAITLAPLALAFHFFRSRGFKRGTVATAAMLGLLVLFRLSGELGAYTVRLMRH